MDGPVESRVGETAPCLKARPGRTRLMPGDRLGPYQILALLGAGGLGEVYDAFDPRLNRHVALKVLTRRAVAEGFQSRFLLEAKATASVNHPNIAHVYEIADAGGICYIAMEHIEGVTLRQKMSAPETTLAELLEYLRQAANAVAKAHARGVVHCDLKPENIMVTREGLVKVLDFGLAKLVERYRRAENSGGAPESSERHASSDPRAGVIAGTVGYMSPEQAEGHADIDQRSDVFSFGCILFEAATRRLPFDDASAARVLNKVVHEQPPRIADLRPDAPPALQQLVDRCLEKNPDKRCPSLEEVSHSLSDLLREMGAASGMPVELLAPRTRTEHRRAVLRRWALAAAAALIALTAGVIGLSRRPPAAAPPPAVAVIPLVNASRTPESEYLSDGVSEALINALAQLPDLRVIARSSSFRFKAEKMDARRVARALRAQALVTGRVAELGGRLRIGVELVNGADGTQTWGAHYDSAVSHLPALTAIISRDIAARLCSHLTPAGQARLSRQVTAKPEAYELFLRGRYEAQLYTPASRQKAVAYFQQALALDPGFALANAELASCYRMLSGSAILSPREMMPKAEAAARRALAVDAGLAEAHVALADIKKDQWDWPAAERGYRRALELSPNLAAAHQGLAIHLSVTGRHEEAIAAIERVRELDPVGLPAAIHTAAVYYNARRYEQALEAARRAAELDPFAPQPAVWTGIINGGRGQFGEAIQAYENAVRLGDDTAATQCYYAYALARSGRAASARRILKRLLASGVFVPLSSLAVLYTGLDQRDQALQCLEKAYASRDPLLQYIQVESHFDRLRDDPRFHKLAARIGLAR